MELGQGLHFHTCTVWNFPNVAQSSYFQKQLHSFIWGNMLQCLIILTKYKYSQEPGMELSYRNSNVFVSDNETLRNCRNSHGEDPTLSAIV